MTIIYILFVLLNSVRSFMPSYSACFFIPNNDNLYNMFQHNNENNVFVKQFAIHHDKHVKCCKSIFLNEPSNSNEQNKNLCSNETAEDDDLTKLEKMETDMMIAFQKMRRHNKKILYRNLKNIYKLLKKKNSNPFK